MYSQKKFGFGLLAIAAVLLGSALPLGAQQLYQANFELPFAAHWGGTTLEPGQYTITVEQSLASRLIRIHGEHGTSLVLAGSYKPEAPAEHGRLTFAKLDGNYVVQEFSAGPLGQAFTFPAPKSAP